MLMIVRFFLMALLTLGLFQCTEEDNSSPTLASSSSTVEDEIVLDEEAFDLMDPEELKLVHAVITTEYGELELEFYPEDAPEHVRNFLKLAVTGFYDGTTFHRVIKDFMIQGGDPNSKDEDATNDGFGGPGYTIDAEFNSRTHDPGILSMARSTDYNSAGCQFFILHKATPDLDGQYTVFGNTVSGFEMVEAIIEVPVGANDRPIEDIPMTITLVPITE